MVTYIFRKPQNITMKRASIIPYIINMFCIKYNSKYEMLKNSATYNVSVVKAEKCHTYSP